MWVDYRGPLSTVYDDGEISTCGSIVEVHSVQSAMMGRSQHIDRSYYSTEVHSGQATEVHSGQATEVHPGQATEVHSGQATEVHSGQTTEVHPGQATEVHPGQATGRVGKY